MSIESNNNHCQQSFLCEDEQQQQQQQTMPELIRTLANFLDDFLILLSSIIERECRNPQFQLQQILFVIERLQQLHTILITETNSIRFDIRSISLFLHDLASFIRYLGQEQQRNGNLTDHQQINMFAQLLDRLERTALACLCSSTADGYQDTPPLITSNEDLACCNPCIPTCGMPWSFLWQLQATNCSQNPCVIMYGIDDDDVHKNLGYRIQENRSLRRRKERKSRKETKLNNVHTRQVFRSTSISPVLEKQDTISNKKTESSKLRSRIQSRLSSNSLLAGSRRNLPSLMSSTLVLHQPSLVNSKQISQVQNGSIDDFDVDDPLQLRSVQVQLKKAPHKRISNLSVLRQKSESGIIDHTSPSKSRIERSPSKIVYRMPRDSSQASIPITSPNTQQSRENSLLNNEINEKSSLNIQLTGDGFTPKTSAHRSRESSFVSLGTRASANRIDDDRRQLNKTWEQRLMSQQSAISSRRTSNITLQQQQQPSSMKENQSRVLTNVNQSQRQMSVSRSFIFNPINNDDSRQDQESIPSPPSIRQKLEQLTATRLNAVSSLNMIEGPQSAEGSSTAINVQHFLSTTNVLTQQPQQSASALESGIHLVPRVKNVKHRRQQPINDTYLKKLKGCFRRVIRTQE